MNNTGGDVRTSKHGEKYIVISGENKSRIRIKFLAEHGYEMTVTRQALKNNFLKNPYTPSVCGVGYMGEGPYVAKIDGKHLPEYATWSSMMKRAYSDATHANRPTYIGRFVCEEWHNYQVYAAWYNEQYKEDGWQLDKDIIRKGNNVYSPDNCRFVPRDINTALTLRKRDRGDCPIGSSRTKQGGVYGYSVEVNTCGKKNHLGFCVTAEEAFSRYKAAKEKYLKELADHYKDVICEEIYDGLYRWEIEIDD